jgi:diguanylate cyclase (GGDEF)-like protein
MTAGSVAGRYSRGLKRGVLLPVLAITLAAASAATFGLYWAAARSDAISVERQVRETQQAISSSLDELALNQEAVAIWDDPIVELRKPEPDWQWFDDNFGIWLNNLFGHDQVFILDAADIPTYGAVDGARVDPARYAEISGDLRHLVENARGREMEEANIHSRPPGGALSPNSTVRTSDKAVHATEVTSLLGRPAVASVMRMAPLTDKVMQIEGSEPLLVSFRFLDDDFLSELSKRNLINSPRFSLLSHTAVGEYAWPITSEHEETIGYFIWKPELPGSALIRAIAPVAGASIGVMVLLMALLAFWLHRSMRAQEATILELEASEAQAHHLAFHDALTGLPNRAKFNDQADKEVARARRGEPIAILLLDLDRFKHVNDTLGHQAGDALIRDFGDRLLHIVHEGDTVARLGGDEFAILLRDASNQDAVEQLCEQILAAVRQPFELLGNSAFVGVSIGIAIGCGAGAERIDLMRKADIALYRAKGEGRDCFRLFTPTMDEGVRLRGLIEEELRIALANGAGLKVHYQPQVAHSGNCIVGLEALVRWQHPRLGLVAPDQFIGIAEQTGLISQLGEWVLREACSAAKRWPDLFIAVNLSPVQFRTKGIAERLTTIVRDSGVEASRIELEVTEGVLLDDSDTVIDTLRQLRSAGFRIALDDFGTGYSSLSYLRRFQVDKIKIDRSFVQHLGHAVDSTAIISAILTLGHAMGLTITAEGVETAEQQDFLEAAGCNAMQGFLFSRPLPEEEIATLLGTIEQSRGAA